MRGSRGDSRFTVLDQVMDLVMVEWLLAFWKKTAERTFYSRDKSEEHRTPHGMSIPHLGSDVRLTQVDSVLINITTKIAVRVSIM